MNLTTVNPVPTTPKWTTEHILAIHRWTDALWSLRISRPPAFRFQPGHYVRLGLPIDVEAPIWRPYSVVSAPAEETLEVLLVLIPGGALTAQIASMEVGSPILLDRSCFGFFLANELAPGRYLWMLASGTGLGPYMSMLREGTVLRDYESIIVVHSARTTDELAYRDELLALRQTHGERVQYLPVVTRESHHGVLHERIPQLIADGRLEATAHVSMDAVQSRVMVCGNPDFTATMRTLLNERHFLPCRRNAPGSMLFEKYW